MKLWLTALGLLIPFLGTSLGAACVLPARRTLNSQVQRGLTGFAAGVMVAASVWSLLLPAMDQAAYMGKWAFLPAVLGFWGGVFFLLLLDHAVPHLHLGSDEAEGPGSGLSRTAKLVLAVTIHNIPEGMAVGAIFAGYLAGDAGITVSGALVLAAGIALQNFPEGAIISLPLRAEGVSRRKALLWGIISGVVEPAAAALTVLGAGLLVPVLPYLLSFAAGAMLYVVVEELIPEMSVGRHSNVGTLTFSLGFTIMMALDVALG